MSELMEMLSYTFLQRAFLVGVLVSLCAALLGVSLVLKRYAMIGDGLSHVGFGALAAATAMNLAPLAVSIPVVVVAAFLLLRLSENSKLRGDSAIALLSTGALAVGVMILSFSSGMNVDVYSYMFGSILALSHTDMILSVILSIVILALFVFFYSKLFTVTFDESFARAIGIPVEACHVLLAVLTAVTIAIGMRLMGSLLISALIIFPPLTAMRVCKSFRGVVITSGILSVICFLIGIVISYMAGAPAGPSVVCVDLAAFLIASLIGRLCRKRA